MKPLYLWSRVLNLQHLRKY